MSIFVTPFILIFAMPKVIQCPEVVFEKEIICQIICCLLNLAEYMLKVMILSKEFVYSDSRTLKLTLASGLFSVLKMYCYLFKILPSILKVLAMSAGDHFHLICLVNNACFWHYQEIVQDKFLQNRFLIM